MSAPAERPEVQPLAGLRYTPHAGDPAALLSPPYDVIDEAMRQDLLRRSEFNVVRLEMPAAPGDSLAYSDAARTLARWREQGVLATDARPALYLHEHGFDRGQGSRRGFFARVRVSPTEAGAIRPHEATHAAARAERRTLLRALATQVSPILLTYRAARPLVLPGREPDLTASGDAESHRLWRIEDPADVAAIAASVTGALYIADGHHRYATALAYRDEVKASRTAWRGDEPENFALAELVPLEEMTVKAWHRLLPPERVPSDYAARLDRLFLREDVDPAALAARLADAGRKGPAFGLIAPGRRAALLTVRNAEQVAQALPADRSPEWRALDVAVLDHVLLGAGFGIDGAGHGRQALSYTADADRARAEVAAGSAGLALLLNPTPVEQVLAVADAGELMPAKSTCFYPKLPTGLVLYPFAASEVT